MVKSMFSVDKHMKDLGVFLWIRIRNQCRKFKVNVNNLFYFSPNPNQNIVNGFGALEGQMKLQDLSSNRHILV